MVKELHRNDSIPHASVPNKGGCSSLCSNKGNQHPPFLGGLSDSITEKEVESIRYLAKILVRISLQSENFHGGKKGSNILPCIDKGTG